MYDRILENKSHAITRTSSFNSVIYSGIQKNPAYLNNYR